MSKWTARRINDTSRPFAVLDDDGNIVCGSTTEADAALIAKAVNMHDDLVAALRHALTLAENIMLERN